MMLITSSDNTKPKGSVAYIYKDSSQLGFLKLSKSEEQYLAESEALKQNKVVRLNRYPDFVYLVKLDKGRSALSSHLETLRLLGCKTAKIMAGEKTEKLSIVGLSKKDDAIPFA